MSDKTNAAIAAEQQAAATEESSAAQQAEALPAATLEELEEFDIGSVADQGPRASGSRTTAAQTGPSAR